jgi:potassium-transporting ATPase KdpC subunit
MSRLPIWVRNHLVALRALLVFTVITGIAYPLVMTGVAQALPKQADGSLVKADGRVVGSSLLCQEFVDSKGNQLPQWFQPRPSAAAEADDPTDHGCDALDSTASNLGPNNPVLVKQVKTLKAQVASFNGVPESQVPADAVTNSGSGLDPDISTDYAYLQVNRVAAARHLPVATVHQLVASHVQGRTIGFLGEPRVDVLTLDIALSELPGQSG